MVVFDNVFTACNIRNYFPWAGNNNGETLNLKSTLTSNVFGKTY